jgi:hypothetical protein
VKRELDVLFRDETTKPEKADVSGRRKYLLASNGTASELELLQVQ